MYEWDAKRKAFAVDPSGRPRAKTAHTLNPVWFIVYDPRPGSDLRINPDIKEPGLANVAATCFTLLGLDPPDLYDPPLVVAG